MASNAYLSQNGNATLPGGRNAILASSMLSSASQLQVSYYDLKNEPYTDYSKQERFQWADVFQGGTQWGRAIDLIEQGYQDKTGALLSVPAGVTRFVGTAVLSTVNRNPTYYNGKTFVAVASQGRHGPNGSMGLSWTSGLGTPTVDLNLEQDFTVGASQTQFTFTGAAGYTAEQIGVYQGPTTANTTSDDKLLPTTDYTVADSGGDLIVTIPGAVTGQNVFCSLVRREWPINDAALAPASGFWRTFNCAAGDPDVENFIYSLFLKENEADFWAARTQPYKGFLPELRQWFSVHNVIRQLDLFGPVMMNTATSPSEVAELTDATWKAVPNGTYNDFEWDLGGQLYRAANCTEQTIDLCANAYAGARSPWLCIPWAIGSPFRPCDRNTRIQFGTSKSFHYISEEIDLGQPFTQATKPAGALDAVIDVARRRIEVDTSHTTHTSGETTEIWTFNCTRKNGGGAATVSLPVRAIHWAGAGQNLNRTSGGALFEQNQAFINSSTAWREWADYIIAKLQLYGFPFGVQVKIELGNEVWNRSAARFELSTLYFEGLGNWLGFTSEKLSGHGWATAKLKKVLDDAQTAAGTNYNICMIVPGQAANPDVQRQKLKGYEYYWTNEEGLSGQALADQMILAGGSAANYYSGPFFFNTADPTGSAARNMTGLNDLTAHVNQVLAWEADGSLTTRVRDWYFGPNKPVNLQWNIDQWLAHKVHTDFYGATFIGGYEGSSHDDNAGGINVPSGLTSDGPFLLWYDANMNGTLGGELWTELVTRIRANFQPGIIISHYGGPYDPDQIGGDFGQPWGKGDLFKPDLGPWAAIKASGLAEEPGT